MSIRGIYSTITDIRRQVFTEVARIGYEGGDYSRIEDLPYKIVPGEVAEHRSSIFLERAIVGERLRLAMGLSPRPLDQHAPLAAGVEESARPEKYYEPPLVNILKFACNACPEKRYIVTNLCQNCLAHPCREICPKKAVKLSHRGVSRIQEDLCIRCGKCADVCPYNAIILQERPCAKACGMDAIRSDEHGRADIDYDKCVSCGMCLVNCPFGAISDKSQLFQLTQALRGGEKVIAIVAPAFVGQLGPSMTPDKLKAAMKMLGFRHVAEVAVGADLCTLDEAKDFLEKVPAEQPFMATSCCPSWAVMAKKLFPEQANCISMALTPMVLTARLCKQQHPGEKVAFIGPCSAKKLEAMRTTVRSEVDFVLTFEEVMGMFEAKDINFNEITQTAPLREGTAAGRGFAVSGGVAEAVREAISHIDPDREENALLRELLELREQRRDLTFESAAVIDRESTNWTSALTLNRGTAHGVEKNDCVVSAEGDLVGVVSAVGYNWCTVLTLIDTDSSLGARVFRTQEVAVAEGDLALMGEGKLKLSYLSADAQLLSGDVVTTSGLGGFYPGGLVIGTVESVRTGDDGLAQYAVLAPAARLGELSEVFIIKDFDIVD